MGYNLETVKALKLNFGVKKFSTFMQGGQEGGDAKEKYPAPGGPEEEIK